MKILQAYNLLAFTYEIFHQKPFFFFQNFVRSIKLIINHVWFIA